MAIKWYHNSKTGEIDYYESCGTLTDFPRGVLLAYGDYLTTGFDTKEDAEKWAGEWVACPKCKTTVKPKEGCCPHCNLELGIKTLEDK